MPASAQRADDNATVDAPDAFGTTVGNETIGLYDETQVRGFNPTIAGNVRIQGLYFDEVGALSDRLIDRTNIRVGLSALNFQLPAPSGIVDQTLRVPAATLVTTSVGLGDYLSPFAAVDGGLVSHDGRWTFGYGARVDLPRRDETGGSYRVMDLSGLLRVKVTNQVEVTLFATRLTTADSDARVTIYTAGPYLPPTIERRIRYAQPWASSDSRSVNAGAIINGDFGHGWNLRGGLFASTLKPVPGYAEQYILVSPAGQGRDQVVIRNPDTRYRSYSGELRLSKVVREGPRTHLLSLGTRGRSSRQQYGGDDLVTIGPRTLDRLEVAPEPVAAFGPQTLDEVRQIAGTLTYRLDWANVGLFNIGLQKVRFEKAVADQPVTTGSVRRGVSSPFLYNIGFGANVTRSLVVYGSYSKGLEEGGTAPPSAPNRNTVLPVVITRQKEFGLRWEIVPAATLTGAVFALNRPFADLNPANANRYEFVGERRNSGVELSLRTQPVANLSVVAGAVLLRSRLSGPGVDGLTPIGTIGRTILVNANYAVPQLAGVSFDLSFASYHRLVASHDNRVYIPDREILGIGTRYRFRSWGGTHVLRFYVANVTNVFGWNVSDDGGFQYNRPRRFSLSLTSDW